MPNKRQVKKNLKKYGQKGRGAGVNSKRRLRKASKILTERK